MKKTLGLLLGLGLFAPLPALANCNATANAPALTAGTQPCSMDLSGNLRTTGSSAVTGTVAVSSLPALPTGANVIGLTIPTTSSNVSFGQASIQTATVAGSLVLKASAGNLYEVDATAAGAGFLMVFNAITAPADGTVTPVECMPLAAGGEARITPPIGEAFSTGMTAVFSTTGCFTKTISATAFIHAQVK